jgi:hypothetical protein
MHYPRVFSEGSRNIRGKNKKLSAMRLDHDGTYQKEFATANEL